MQASRKELFAALAMIAAGLLAFVVVLALVEGDTDEHPLGVLEWVIAGVLIGPGFGYLIRWRRRRDRNRAAASPHDPR